MSEKLKVVQFGLGPIGMASARLALQKPGMDVVGAIDIAEHLVGRDLGEVLGLSKPLGIEVHPDASAVLERTRPDVVLHTTSSFLPRVEDQLMPCIHAGANVVSSTEELFYPYYRDPEFCDRIDKAAKEHGVIVVGTGVNPGFSMDVLPLTLTGICAEVKKVRALRVVDASHRRGPLQRKIGAGLEKAEFEKRVSENKLGHIGLLESLLAIADGLNWHPETIDEKVEPVLAQKAIRTPFVEVQPGQVAGIRHTCVASINDTPVIELELQMYVGADDPNDSVFIDGDPPINMRIDGGIFGDTATVAALINTAGRLQGLSPGLKTMLDLPVPRAFL
ncbi:MAG: dihydrodipicolinate reductase [candidate division KSB1 bacterium]|nr:dihydrodipicolinate reductase [candidate division KSB1 bacterium]